MVGRLGKYFAKVAGDEKTLAENKAKDAEFLSKKAVAKVVKLAEEVKHEVETYREDLVEKEAIALKAATDAVGKLVAKAQVRLACI